MAGLNKAVRLAALAPALAACSARYDPPRVPSFPIGMFGVEDPRSFERLRDAGFDCVQSYSIDTRKLGDLASAARRSRMRIMVRPDSLLASPPPRGWPLLAWYLADEPEGAGMTPQAFAALGTKIRAWSPGGATAFTVGIGTAAAPYAAAADAVLVDWYPVPHLPLESVGAQVRAAVAGARGKPVWAVLQAMDWRDYRQRSPGRRIGRFPDLAEIRFMSYDAVLEGAKGIWYFTDTRPDGSSLGDSPELWFAVADVSRELRGLAPILARGRPIPPPFPRGPGTPPARAWTYRGREYVLLVNPDGRVDAAVPRELLEGDWRPLYEARRDARELLESRAGNFYLKPYQVLVLESPLRFLRLLGRG